MLLDTRRTTEIPPFRKNKTKTSLSFLKSYRCKVYLKSKLSDRVLGFWTYTEGEPMRSAGVGKA